MDTYVVSFFGHRRIDDPLNVDRRLDVLIRRLLLEKSYVEFLVGRDGDFEQLVASAIRRAKRTVREDNSSLVWVLPYATAEYRNNAESYQEYYDEVEICKAAAGSHYKAAFQARNRRMVDRSNFVVFCIDHNFGGAYQTMLDYFVACEYRENGNIDLLIAYLPARFERCDWFPKSVLF